MKNLVIIESPGKAAKLKEILGPNFDVVASVGHIRDLPRKELGIKLDNGTYEPTYELTERGSEVVKRLKGKVANSDCIYLATDPDREGEAIAWHLKSSLKLKAAKRVTFNVITKAAVLAAFNNPRDIDTQLVNAQITRRSLDRLVGYLTSPTLSNLTGESLSAGRVQSVAVRLVVERDRAIANFKPTTHFGAKFNFVNDDLKWFGLWDTSDFVSESEPYFLDGVFASKVAQLCSFAIHASKETETSVNPPPPYISSSLQQAGSVKLGLNPKKVMDIAQRLYEQGAITYHRTDNPNITDEAMEQIRAIAPNYEWELVEKRRAFKTSADAQAGHPAITPTHWEHENAGDSDDEKAIYELIRLRAIASQMKAAKYAVREIRLNTTLEGKEIVVVARSKTLISKGWLDCINGDETQQNDDTESDANTQSELPTVVQGDRISAASAEIVEKTTRAPKQFTEASLIAKLESEGIGRPATYAAIMENIMAREYVALSRAKGRFLTGTPTGQLVVDALVGKCAFIELGYTREIEKALDLIAQGKQTYVKTLGDVHRLLAHELAALHINQPIYSCPQCSKPLRQVRLKNNVFWGCSGYPDCKSSMHDNNGVPTPKPQSAEPGFQCPVCGKDLIHRVKKGKGGYDFWGCSGFPSGCKKTYDDKNGRPQFDEKAIN
jgi:DNA topoisomerase-1